MRPFTQNLWALVVVGFFLFPHAIIERTVADENVKRSGPLSANESRKKIVVPPQYKVELVAAEPNVVDPVAIRFDEDGRLWVIEMRDYPLGPPAGEAPLSTIRILRDKDSDGYYETATVFAEQLLFPTGLQPWRGGVIVTLSGKIVYMKDEDGDDRCDLQETWFTGFAEQNSQLRANHPILGMDGHVYVANGLRGGKIVNARNPKQPPLEIRGYDFRFDPITGRAEAVTGMGQFGLTFDPFGERFVCSNRNPAKHIVLENRYLQKNPHAIISQTANDVAVAGEASRVFPLVKAWTTSNLHAGQFTAACGVTYYGDPQLGHLQGSVFTCEPTGSLVHCEVVTSAGASFTSRPVSESKEFLASTDSWFRPVNLDVGPDGSLYVVDMYRAVIEHPQWVPAELKTRLDQRYGDDRGRIYRVVATGSNIAKNSNTAKKHEKMVSLSGSGPLDLVKALSSPTAWERDTAARLLQENQSEFPVAALQQVVHSRSRPEAKAKAIWLLRSVGKLREADVIAGLQEGGPKVVATTLQAGDDFVRTSGEVRKLAWSFRSHEDPALRFRCLLSVAPVNGQSEARMLKEAMAEEIDPWVVSAGLVACGDHAVDVLRDMFVTPQERRQGTNRSLEQLAALAVATGAEANEILRLVENANAADAQSLILGVFKRSKTPSSVLSQATKKSPLLRKRLTEIVQCAKNSMYGVDERTYGISVLAYYPDSAAELRALIDGDETTEVREAAVQALARSPDPSVWRSLLQSVRSYPPGLRRAVLDGMIGNSQLLTLLLDAVAAGKVPVTMFEPHQIRRLSTHGNIELRERAKKLVAAIVPADRQVVLSQYQAALKLQADPLAGRQVFKARCGNCHKIAGIGFGVGPDISDSRTRTPAQLLTDILQPSRAVDAAFMGYTVITVEGKTLNGVLQTENSNSITLKQLGGKTVVLSRSEIEEIRSDGISFMPNGLEKDISRQQMADLISFIKNWRYLDGEIPLSEPVLSKPE